jgi:signal-transduction protein with cAMP-binding, CBS, and nucleotidyltransferase domain
MFMSLAESDTSLDYYKLRVFDFRGVCDDQEMVCRFRDHIIMAIQQRPRLLERMRAANDTSRLPLCFYRDKVVTSGGMWDRLDLKGDLLTPFVSAVRLLSLEKAIKASTTRDRLTALSQSGVLSQERAADLGEIYTWLVQSCLQRSLERGTSIDWTLDPRLCTSEEKRLLTESFRMVKETVEKAC